MQIVGSGNMSYASNSYIFYWTQLLFPSKHVCMGGFILLYNCLRTLRERHRFQNCDIDGTTTTTTSGPCGMKLCFTFVGQAQWGHGYQLVTVHTHINFIVLPNHPNQVVHRIQQCMFYILAIWKDISGCHISTLQCCPTPRPGHQHHDLISHIILTLSQPIFTLS